MIAMCGDMLHLASIVILLAKIYGTRNAKGISLKTQVLYAAVFLTRYLDLFWSYISMYNSVMKLLYIATSILIVYLMKFRRPICLTYSPQQDNFRVSVLVAPCALLALLTTADYSVSEILWTFSIYLEAVAIVPQLIVVHKYAKAQDGAVENLTSTYVACLGGYRALYLVNWVWRFATEKHYWNPIVWVAGIVQTVIYADFLYYFVTAHVAGKNVTLPI